MRFRDVGTSTLHSTIPALRWLPSWRVGLGRNVIAALAVWAVLVPQSMAYASLAGVPPINGLYAAIAALLVYALLGTSRQLNVGPSSGVAVLSAAAIAPLAVGNSERYLALSAGLALVTGLILVGAGIGRLGFVAEFLAKPVLAGYVVGLGMVIAVGQVPALLGLSIDADGFFAKAAEIVFDLPDAQAWTVVVGVGTLTMLLVLQRVAPRAPGALIAVVVGVLASRALDLADDDVALVGSITVSFPELGPPDLHVDDLERLIAAALGVALLAYAESIAAARRFAAKHGYEVEPNRELIAVGASNVAAGLAQGFPVDAGMSRTSVADRAGQTSQLAGLLNVGFVILTDHPAHGVLRRPPEGHARRDHHRRGATAHAHRGAAEAATAGRRRLRIRRYLPHGCPPPRCAPGSRRRGARVARCARVPQLPAEHGGARAPARQRGRRRGHPLPGRLPARRARDLSGARDLPLRPGDLLREHEALSRRLLRAINASPTDVEEVLVDAGAITHVDTSGLDMLADLHAELAGKGIRLCLARVKGPIRDKFERAGLIELLGPDGIQPSVRSGVNAYLRRKPHLAPPLAPGIVRGATR